MWFTKRHGPLAYGLAWTETGGTLLPVEAVRFAGNGELILTGNLGDVMKESARTALSYLRSVAPRYAFAIDLMIKSDFHIHVPEGAIPKDGPSAGITLASALLSALSEVPPRPKVAMTGELTLTGRILAIGGLKEKNARGYPQRHGDRPDSQNESRRVRRTRRGHKHAKKIELVENASKSFDLLFGKRSWRRPKESRGLLEPKG
jgi:ATP-dependent Lon protease